MLCCDTARGRHSRRLACLRSHVLRAYCNFESKQANSITLFGRRPNNNKTCKKNRFHAWCDMEERILETRDESSGSVLYNKPILWLSQTRCNMSRVLVTGASGYLAMHVVKQLVDSGEYIVRGTGRSLANETKVKPLKELSSENDKYPLELVEADLTKKETWVEWVIISKGLFISKQVENNADMNERRFGVI